MTAIPATAKAPAARPLPTPTPKPAATAQANEMTLDSIVTADDQRYRICVYGEGGIGKSLLASGAEAPVWLPVENPRLKGIKKFKQPQTIEAVHQAINTLAAGRHPYKTFVIDTVDEVEKLIWARVTNNWTTTMAKAHGGFQAGYHAAYELWRMFLSALERLDMNIILLGHSTVRSAANPDGDNYERYSMKLFETKEAKPGALIRGWCDAVLFAGYEVTTYKGEKDRVAKAVDGGARFLHTQWRPSFDAKNRFNMPPKLPLSWDEVEPYLLGTASGGAAALIEIRAKIDAALERLSDVPAEKFNRVAFAKALTTAGDDAAQLGRLLERLHGKIAIEAPAIAQGSSTPPT